MEREVGQSLYLHKDIIANKIIEAAIEEFVVTKKIQKSDLVHFSRKVDAILTTAISAILESLQKSAKKTE